MAGMTDERWVERLDAYCFTAVVGVDPDEAARRLGGDLGSWQPRTFEECFWALDGPQWAQVGRVDGGVLIAEHNGWRGEEKAETLSDGARLACLFRNVHAEMRFVYAVHGAVVAEFDPLVDPPTARAHAIDHELRDLPFGLFDAERSGLSLLSRLTGIRVRQAWLEAPQPAIPLML